MLLFMSGRSVGGGGILALIAFWKCLLGHCYVKKFLLLILSVIVYTRLTGC